MGKRTKVALWTFLATALLVLLVANLSLGDKRVDQRVESLYAIDDPQFSATIGAILGPAIVPGNRVEALVNGDQIFPAMLAAIRAAQRTIDFETYIYWSGKVGDAFAEALSERARAGVQVHLMLDALGSGKIDDEALARMTSAGVQVRRYNPLRWNSLARMNNRTHRKILVVDGATGFTGGVGIADEWSGNAQDPDHWRDTHFRISGPVVAQMQGAFMENWIEVTGEVLHGADYFRALAPAGAQDAQHFLSAPGSETMQLMYLLSIAAARTNIDLSAAYFVPDNVEIRTLVAAMKRGVRLRIIAPGAGTDVPAVRRASRARWGELLEAGAEIYEYQPTMFHCKVMVVDGLWTSVGSTNFDNRSFSVNDESNLNVRDAQFAREQTRIFEQDLKKSQRVTLEAWRSRPWTEKLLEHTLGLLGAQL